MEYRLIKDKRRKKMIMTVENDGTVVIKAPYRTRKSTIEQFYKSNTQWIEGRRKALYDNMDKITVLTDEDVKQLKKKAVHIMTAKTEYYSALMDVKHDNIKITSASKRWGSCTRRKNKYTICYSYRNMFLTDRCQDYIVVHELAHIRHMNHSADFYAFIEKVMPDYRERIKEIQQFRDFYIHKTDV